MIYLTLLSALLLSAIAGYYSIIGLAAIFTGAFWPIVFMGSVLEMSKLVTASWLYRNWKTCPLLLKSYFVSAVVILMMITSMGIFGFLAKAHIDSTLDSGANTVEVKTLNMQEKIAKERLDYLLLRAKDPSTASSRLDSQIQTTQKELTEISKKKLPLLKESNKLIAEVGPIKYVGDMIYGTQDDTAIDKAVRLVIMLIMVVFDPLAVLLLIAANMSMKQKKEEGTPIIKNGEIIGVTASDIPVFTDTVNSAKEFFNKVRKTSKKLDKDKIEIQKENITIVQEEPIVLDEATGETIPPLAPLRVHQVPGVYTEHHDEETKKKLQPKYDYEAEYAFKEKKDSK
jgi:hypothetical protein